MADGVSVSCSMSRSEEEAGRRVLGHECVQRAGRCGMQGCSCECIDQVGETSSSKQGSRLLASAVQQQARQQATGKCGAAASSRSSVQLAGMAAVGKNEEGLV